MNEPLPELFRRKRDGQLYWCAPTNTFSFPTWGVSVKLFPHWQGRTHWKSLAAFEREYVKADEPEPFYADCPHCDRTNFADKDDYFEHVSCCEWEQSLEDRCP